MVATRRSPVGYLGSSMVCRKMEGGRGFASDSPKMVEFIRTAIWLVRLLVGGESAGTSGWVVLNVIGWSAGWRELASGSEDVAGAPVAGGCSAVFLWLFRPCLR